MMTLADIEVFVGVVIDVADPKSLGRVKVSSPGIFDPALQNKDSIPWVSPITINYQNYSQLNAGNKVFVFHNIHNYLSYYYLPFFELNPNTASLLDTGKDVDIIISRRNGSDFNTQLYYNTADGLVGRTGDYHVQLTPNGDVDIAGHRTTKILNEGLTTIGNPDNGSEKTVNGETLCRKIDALMTALLNFATIMTSNPYTAAGAQKLSSDISAVDKKYPTDSLLSESVTVCK